MTRALGFSRWALVGLAALAAPRVVLSDLRVVERGALVTALAVFLPPLCWIAAVVWRRPPRPFFAGVMIGAIYGMLLAAVHQLLWAENSGIPGPTLVGDPVVLEDEARERIARTADAASDVFTGLRAGVVAGGIAALLCRIVPRRRK